MPCGVVALEAFLPLVAEHKPGLLPVWRRCFGNNWVFSSSGCACCFGSSCSPEQAVRLVLVYPPPLQPSLLLVRAAAVTAPLERIWDILSTSNGNS